MTLSEMAERILRALNQSPKMMSRAEITKAIGTRPDNDDFKMAMMELKVKAEIFPHRRTTDEDLETFVIVYLGRYQRKMEY